MMRWLRRAWDFDLLLWLARRYKYEYAYYCVYPPRHQQPRSAPLYLNFKGADVTAAEFLKQAAALTPDDDEPPADQWRDYGPSEVA